MRQRVGVKAKIEDAIRAIDGQNVFRNRPWEHAIVERQRPVRDAYAAVAQELRGARDEMSCQVAG